MIQTGILLTKQIDFFTHKHISTYPQDYLHRIISTGQGHIRRMLHYFPFQAKGATQNNYGWHNDYGALTALTAAMYIDQNGKQIQLATNTGGLFAQNRFTEMARINILQLGQSAQILGGGYLQATPHCVVRSEQLAGKKIGIDTFTLFMQPDLIFQ